MVDDANPHRLPRTVSPKRYDLTLTPDLPGATFTGSVDIDLVVHDATDTVVLNAADLELHEATVVQGDERRPAEVTLDDEAERATLTLPEPLEPGAAVVSIRFSGILNDKLAGFYRSTFTDDAGVEHVIATTQFEATDARRAFPCWDEPDRKAAFAITLRVDPDLFAVSNAAVLSDEVAPDGLREVRFAETMVMSTYLVAFIVGPLEATKPVDVDGTPLRIVYPPERAALTGFGLEIGAFSLRYLAEYFALPYPGDSLDLVAVPDFAFGAMENLGCVTFRETLLLADPTTTTQGEQQNVVDVIAHELAHMWFGDLVTMDWWNGIWLNEAFATFMEMKVTDAFRPAWQRWVSFGLSRSMAFDTDALEATRPIEYPVVSPEDAEGMFDILTYEKGAAVVRMLEQYLGEDRFREGIRHYMTTNAYGNTDTTDLWDAIEEATGEPVRRIMDSWIFQGGHPIVTIDAPVDGRVLRLSQQRFRYLPDPSDRSRWAVPLHLRYATASGKVHTATELLEGDELEIDLPEPVTWVVGNVEGHGFYRVRPVGPLHQALAERAMDELSPLERYGLADDTWASVLAGTTSAEDYVALAERLGAETDVSVWRRLLGGLTEIDRVTPPADRAPLQARVRALVLPALERLGWAPRPGESDRDRELRAALIGAAVTLGGDPAALEQVRELFAAVRGETTEVEPNIAGAVVRAVAAFARPEDLDELIAGFKAGGTPQAEQRYLFALAEVRDPALFDRVLELATSPDVRTQNAPYLLSACIANRDNGPIAWATVRDRWEELTERFPSNSIDRMLAGVRTISDRDVAADVERFVEAHPIPQAKQTVAQHLERMRVTVALRERLQRAPTSG
ncbi:MAG TPA: M1 family metallopeptidase [Acidimicrobiales bacterium]|nr:M1 family metallopeptidase [Acidimicrobiales bacterium]